MRLMTKDKSPWRPMSTAPMDGTITLVTETANGEDFNVLPGAFMNSGGGQIQFGEKAIGSIGWWAGRPPDTRVRVGNAPCQ